MHVLTKVLVVFAAILSVFLSALTIAYSSNADRITASLSAAQTDREAAIALRSQDSAMFGEEKVRMQARTKDLEGELDSTRQMLRRLEDTNSRLEAEKGKAEAGRQAIEGQIAELGELAKTQAALITGYREEVTQLRKNELDYRSQMLALESRLSDLETQREVLQNNVRALQEQLAEAKLAQDGGTRTASGNPKTTEPYFSTGPLVTGKVETVSQDPASKATLVRVNIGTNDGIRQNMKLIVVRDGTFVANLIVAQPDMRWSICRVELVNADTRGNAFQIRQGDEIRTRAQ